jgi:hypothetical protein
MTERQVIDLLMTNKGEVLTATAWEGFIASGRGFMVSDGQSVGYFPACITAHFPPLIHRRVERLVKSYRPERDIVVLLAVPVDREIMLALGKRTPILSPEAAFLKHTGTEGCPPMQPVYYPVGVQESGTRA